ncbi:very short patch repair endonuclease [Pseudomonas umsongensis]|uniref:very short patch repair endonuclease n=1 Tax=Pseudomonas umsongensis TaxID=198618 RepID=UPI003ECEF2D0
MCADIVTPEQRSVMMSKVRGKNTRPEMVVRSLCHQMGFRFRLHRRDLPGTPDVVFPKYRLCLFVHGCFWHQHPDCKYAHMPTSKVDFWQMKLTQNVERDLRAQKALGIMGWRVITIWECHTKNRDLLRLEIQEAFNT